MKANFFATINSGTIYGVGRSPELSDEMAQRGFAPKSTKCVPCTLAAYNRMVDAGFDLENFCVSTSLVCLMSEIDPVDWKITDISDNGAEHYYRYHVSGINTSNPAQPQEFHWNVRDISSDRFGAHNSASASVLAEVSKAKAQQPKT